MKSVVLEMMKNRGIEIDEMAKIVLEIQLKYCPSITIEDCVEAIDAVLDKREVQYAVLTGLSLDIAAEKGKLEEPLQTAILRDEPLYGMDESVGLAIAHLYGTIGTTNFGYLDKTKMGLIGKLDNSGTQVNTFADDIVCAIVAASAARIVHRENDIIRN